MKGKRARCSKCNSIDCGELRSGYGVKCVARAQISTVHLAFCVAPPGRYRLRASGLLYRSYSFGVHHDEALDLRKTARLDAEVRDRSRDRTEYLMIFTVIEPPDSLCGFRWVVDAFT